MGHVSNIMGRNASRVVSRKAPVLLAQLTHHR